METERSFGLAKDKVQHLVLWARAHKFKAVVAFLGIVLLFEVLSIPWFNVPGLKTENPTETAMMRQRIREAKSDDKQLTIKQQWIPFSRIPRHVINAIIVAEDGTFWEHGGFDWYEFQQSVKKNWEKKRTVRGASTITQQLAKNLYLSTSKDPVRKVKEWVITVLLEHYLDKSRILELYLNVIEWGRGVFGIGAASQAYFGCSASALSIDQAMRLAAVIPSPLKHKPTDNSRWVVFRRNVVSQRMQERRYYDGDIDLDEEETEQPQPKDNQSNHPSIETQASGPGSGSSAMPTDSTDIEKDDSNDVQRRKQAD